MCKNTHSKYTFSICNIQPSACKGYVRKPKWKHHAPCQTSCVRAWVMRWRLTLARTLSLCWVRAIARVGPATWDRERLAAGRAVEGRLSESLVSSAEPPEPGRDKSYYWNNAYKSKVESLKKVYRLTGLAVIGLTVRAEPFFDWDSIKWRCKAFHVIPI